MRLYTVIELKIETQSKLKRFVNTNVNSMKICPVKVNIIMFILCLKLEYDRKMCITCKL